MGRQNRSRKRKDEMNRIKRVRYAAKELQRLHKTLGIVHSEGNVDMQDISEIAIVKTAKQLKKEKHLKEEEEILATMKENENKGENIKSINEKTKTEHIYNTKTMKDQFGTYPPWHKQKKTPKKLRKLNHARKQRFRQAWTTENIPL